MIICIKQTNKLYFLLFRVFSYDISKGFSTGVMQCYLIVAHWHHMATYIWVNIGSGNGLFAWRHQTITWTNIELSSVRFCGMHLREISQQLT